MQKAINDKNVMLWGLKKIDSKLLGPYEKTYKAPIEKRGRPAVKKDSSDKQAIVRKFNIEDDYGINDLDFLNTEYDRIEKDLKKPGLSDDDYEDLENKQEKLYELIENIENMKKFEERRIGGNIEIKTSIGCPLKTSEQVPIEPIIGGLIIDSDKFKCPLCDVSFDTKQKMERHIKTKKHEANIIKEGIENKTNYNKGLLTVERKKKTIIAPIDKPKKQKLKPYFYIGSIPDGYREATEMEAIETGKYSEYGKYKLDFQKVSDFTELGSVFNDKLDEKEMFIKICGLRGKLKKFSKDYSRLINRHGFSKLTKTEQENLKSEASEIKKKFNRVADFINRYSKIILGLKGKPFIEIKFDIDEMSKVEGLRGLPILPKNTVSEPTLTPLIPLEVKREEVKIKKSEKSQIIENSEIVFKCEGRADLVLFPKHFLKLGKLKSTVADKLYKMNIRLTDEFYSDSDKKKYFYHKDVLQKSVKDVLQKSVKDNIGSGIFDRLYKYIPKFNPLEWWKKGRSGYTQQTKQSLERVGDNLIKSIQIMRAPVTPSLISILNVVSYGDFKKKLDQTPYDKLFHLSIIVNGNVLIEKLELISVQILSSGGSIFNSQTEEEDLKPEFKTITSGIIPGLTINKLLENCRNKMGDYKFFSYSGSSNNCQDFILNLLQASAIGNKEDYDFIKQDVETIFEGKESLKSFMDTITDLKGVWTDITGGDLKYETTRSTGFQYETPNITYGPKIQSVIFEKSKGWNNPKSIKWLREHNFDGLLVDNKPRYLRYRQIDPDFLKQQGYIFRTLKIPKGIEYIIGYKGPK